MYISDPLTLAKIRTIAIAAKVTEEDIVRIAVDKLLECLKRDLAPTNQSVLGNPSSN